MFDWQTYTSGLKQCRAHLQMAESSANCDEGASKRKQVRVVAWALPRSCGTALLRAMWNKSSSKALIEPYARAYFVGEERLSNWFVELSPPLRNQKFIDIKTKLYEAAYDGKDEVFAKDLAHYPIMAQTLSYKLEDLLPRGYVHTFLIRSPEAVIKSFYKMYKSRMMPGWRTFRTDAEVGFKETWQLYCFVKENIDPNPLVIVGDDLMNKPETVLRYYCERTGLKYEESMLQWRDDDGLEQTVEVFSAPFAPFYEGALRSDTITSKPPITAADRAAAEIEYPPEVLQSIESNQVWYEKLLAVATRF